VGSNSNSTMVAYSGSDAFAMISSLYLAHGILMVFVWLVAVPLAVGLNIYGRKKNKKWGVKAHMIIMAVVAFLPLTISGLIAFTTTETIFSNSHSVSL
jgi:4-amino-4-deoxy-L-arabinose transferase-like glycosyltransferase